MKNILFILIDNFDYSRIGKNKYRQSPTLFLDELKKKSYWCERMYSQGPYTEAALIGTLCGYDTLTNGGYLKKYKNCPKTLFEAFKENDFQTFGIVWNLFYPSSATRGIDYPYIYPFNFSSVYNFRFDYYSKLYKTNKIEEEDLLDIEDIIEENLLYFIKYYQALLKKDRFVKIVTDNMSLYDIEKYYKIVNEELFAFNKNKKEYCKRVLQKGKDDIIFSLFDNEMLNLKVDKKFVKRTSNKYKNLNDKVYRTNNKLNFVNNLPRIKGIIQSFASSPKNSLLSGNSDFGNYIRNWHTSINYKDLLIRIGENYDETQPKVSFNKLINYFENWNINRNDNKPFFAFIHAGDLHGSAALFDYCSTNENKIDIQMKRIERFCDELPSNYRGNLGYDLSVMNIDYELKELVNKIDNDANYKDTILVITADHGNMANYYPIREKLEHFYDEAYHIPFIIYGKGIEPRIDNDFHISKDIMATLADLCGFEKPEHTTGISIFSDEKRKYVNQEYMGKGCPDMYRRPMLMCAFDENWKVYIKSYIKEDSFNYTIEQIFDEKNDKEELINLSKNKKAISSVQYLIDKLNIRWNEIKVNYSREGIYNK